MSPFFLRAGRLPKIGRIIVGASTFDGCFGPFWRHTMSVPGNCRAPTLFSGFHPCLSSFLYFRIAWPFVVVAHSYLNSSNNQLTVLPDWIGGLNNLMKLNCSNNQLMVLPDSILKLDLLVDLGLEGNELDWIIISDGFDDCWFWTR